MKKLFLIAAICFASHCIAQYNTNLVIVPNPPGALLDWGTKDLTYFITGGPGVPGRVLVKATLKLIDGTPVASTNLAKARIINAGTTTTILYAPDVIPLDVMVFNGRFKTSMDKTGKLPAGTYELCVQLVTPVDFHPVSEEKCRDFTLAAFQLPIPLMPYNETILDLEKAQTAITFRWTPVTPTPGQPVTYRVTVFEILPYQTPMQALRSNQPLLARDIVGTSQYIWQPQLALTICCKDGDVTGDEKNINTSESGLGSGKGQKNINTSEAGVGTGKGQIINNNNNDSAAQKNINTSESGLGSGKGQKNINTSEAGVGTGKGGIIMNSDGTELNMDAYAFIWTIQTFDRQGRPFGDGNINGDGISEPNVFFIDRRPLAMRRSGPPQRTISFRKLKPGTTLIFPPIH